MKAATLFAICLASALILLEGAIPSFADPQGYCDAYARDLANRKAHNAGADAPAGTILNVKASTLIGGGGEGATLETTAANGKWRRAYNNTFDDCMQQYADDSPKPSDDTLKTSDKLKRPAAAAAKPNQKDPGTDGTTKPGTQAWNDYCLSKHPSFDSKTGMYRTWAGNQRKCR